MAKSHAHPGGNITGFFIRPAEASGERLEKLVKTTKKSLNVDLKQVTILLDETNVITPAMFYATWKVADSFGIKLKTLVANTPDQLKRETLRRDALAGSDGFMVFPGAMFWNHHDDVVKLPAFAKVPAIYPEREYGHLYHGYHIPQAFRRAASYVAHILRDRVSPGKLPIEEAQPDSNC